MSLNATFTAIDIFGQLSWDPMVVFFLFLDPYLPMSFSDIWSAPVYNAHIALQELQVVSLMFCKLIIHLCGKVAALFLDNSPVQAYVMKIIWYLFLSM